jgi:hypothetical protein
MDCHVPRRREGVRVRVATPLEICPTRRGSTNRAVGVEPPVMARESVTPELIDDDRKDDAGSLRSALISECTARLRAQRLRADGWTFARGACVERARVAAENERSDARARAAQDCGADSRTRHGPSLGFQLARANSRSRHWDIPATVAWGKVVFGELSNR